MTISKLKYSVSEMTLTNFTYIGEECNHFIGVEVALRYMKGDDFDLLIDNHRKYFIVFRVYL